MGALRIDILVVAYRARNYLARCLKSVSKNTGEGFRLSVYDNRPKNYPLTWIWNKFAEASRRDILVFLNPDVLVGPGWDLEILQCFSEYPNVAVAAPITNATPHYAIQNPVPKKLGPEGIDGIQGKLDELSSSRDRFHVTKDPKAGCGHCFAVRKKSWSTLGGFDDKKYPFGGNEDEFNDRAVKSGMEIAICTRAFSFHYWNRSFKEAKRVGDIARDASQPSFSRPPIGIDFLDI